MIEIKSKSPEQTEELGAHVGKLVKNGDCVLLYGDIGAGKTVFVAGLAREIGIPERPASPTFTLCNTYTVCNSHEECPQKMHHFDLYRLEDAEELFETGLLELIGEESEGITLIEWPEIAESFLPSQFISVTIQKTAEFQDERDIAVECVGDRYAMVEDSLKKLKLY